MRVPHQIQVQGRASVSASRTMKLKTSQVTWTLQLTPSCSPFHDAMLTAELALSASAGPQLAAQVDSGAASGVRWAVLVADGTCRVQLTGPPSMVASAEASIWRMFPGEADVGRWTYLDARGRQHAGFMTDQLFSWSKAGYFPDALPIKNGRSSSFITLGLLLGSRTTGSTNNDNMDVDVLSAAVDELAQQRETGCDTGDIRDLAMPDADPLPSTGVVFVVDTCTLLSSLPRLERVLEALAGAAVALVPWTVIYELDGLKCSQSQEVNKLAREVTHTLERVLRQHSRWRAQSPAEDRIAAAEAERLRPSGSKVTADDKVIAAALVLRKRSIKALVLSNDTNLRVRAGVCSILALPDYAFPGLCTKEALDNVVASMPHVDAENSDGPSMVENAQAMTHASRSFADRSAEVLDMMQQEPCMQPMMQPMSRVSTSEAVDRALALLQMGCCDLMENVYREEFGDQFDIAVQEPPPWSGRSCAKMLVRNWNAVFKIRFNPSVLLAANGVEEAAKAAMRRGGSGDPAAARAVVAYAYDLLQALPADGAGAGPLLHARGELDALRRQLM
jgi:rRNA-processing protein FCF1